MGIEIINIQAFPLQIPLNIPFGQAGNTATHSASVILKLTSAVGVTGYGECCPRPYVTGEDIGSVLKDLQGLESCKKLLCFETLADIQKWMLKEAPLKFGQATLCAIEMALLDVWSRVYAEPLVSLLGGQEKETYAYTGVIPYGNIQKMRYLLEMFHFQQIKIKVNDHLQDNLNRIEKIKSIFGEDVGIQVDVNGGWDLQQACFQVPELIRVGVSCIEQPFPPDKDEQMGWLTWKYGSQVDIMADESVCTYTQATFLLENAFCNRLNLKLSKHGGIFHTLKIAQVAKKQGVAIQLGAHIGETSLLTLAGMLFSSLWGDCLSMEGGMGTYLLKSDVLDTPVMVDREGKIRKSDFSNGLGWGKVLDHRLEGIPLS